MSSIISNQVPLKCKGVMVGNHNIRFLDLGASVNLLHFMVYEKFNLRKLKPINMALYLVERCTRLPRGMVEDVLIKGGN